VSKHVCPICEDVYAAPASVTIRQDSRSSVASGWGCPACGYIFIDVNDVEELIRWAIDSSGVPATSVTGCLVGEPAITRRPESLAASVGSPMP